MTPKVAQDSALATARMSVSFASICLALLSVTDPEGKLALFHLPLSRSVLLLLGVIFVLNASQTIDWIVDNFEEKDWKDLFGSDFCPAKLDQFPARLKLFNGGYVLLSLGMAVLIAIFLSQSLMHFFPDTAKISYGISALFSIYVFLQMMTDKLVKIVYARIASILGIGIVLGAIFF